MRDDHDETAWDAWGLAHDAIHEERGERHVMVRKKRLDEALGALERLRSKARVVVDASFPIGDGEYGVDEKLIEGLRAELPQIVDPREEATE